ncbi:outer membrane protein assembly factor BamD [Pseudomarimonas arenosa]|uniref:Outer membrane protein assembly factor BamD n=1 Tax=Pseudomarimonas arenosa TaxID=2774145 RepID=A0AAW3ZGN7_9GAMM|nr:outer membrane protein assembly factor BamD [Pseudomarimonas arenosa]MBD8524177.1 outer membrane protein assembly factor BamD [Pseudomarimonas arenosa]
MIRYSGFFRSLPRFAPSFLPRALMLSAVLGLVAGCGWFQRKDPLETLPVEEMYATAKESLVGGNLSRAARYYQRLIARFPYGDYTEQAMLELSYAQYRGNKHEEALSSINRFIKTYPAHQKIAYAFYLKALINFERDTGVLERIVRIDSTMRDMTNAKQSFDDFAEVIRRYPDTPYAVDARQRMVYLRNRLARYEINVATYYLRRGAYVAAAQRGKYVLEVYPQSQHQGDALAVLSESYHQLGQEQLASDARRVLELNNPKHPYLSGDWPNERSWLRKLWPFGDRQSG